MQIYLNMFPFIDSPVMYSSFFIILNEKLLKENRGVVKQKSSLWYLLKNAHSPYTLLPDNIHHSMKYVHLYIILDELHLKRLAGKS